MAAIQSTWVSPISRPRAQSGAASEMTARAVGMSAPAARPTTTTPLINRVGPVAEMISSVPTTKIIRSRVNTRDRPNRSPNHPPANDPMAIEKARPADSSPTCHRVRAKWDRHTGRPMATEITVAASR